ncbi:IS66 family insertion sequence element accessory protein TnpB [Nocardioides sp.]|uniref:IS66 family insertion sequence element accessory protein TnpB n=1 Tax=Nocardioides sp. TaxID=35761 RepID=UPI003D12157C
MLLERSGIKILVYKDTIDMRAGFEKLHLYCVQHMQAKMNEGHAYVFFGKNRSRMKILVYDGSGLVLVAKRIERNRFMSHAELLGRTEITLEELKLIFHGGVVRRPVFGEAADRLDQQEFSDRFESVDIKKIFTTQRERLELPMGEMNLPT